MTNQNSSEPDLTKYLFGAYFCTLVDLLFIPDLVQTISEFRSSLPTQHLRHMRFENYYGIALLDVVAAVGAFSALAVFFWFTWTKKFLNERRRQRERDRELRDLEEGKRKSLRKDAWPPV